MDALIQVWLISAKTLKTSLRNGNKITKNSDIDTSYFLSLIRLKKFFLLIANICALKWIKILDIYNAYKLIFKNNCSFL